MLDAEEKLLSTGPTEEDYKKIIAIFDTYFKVRKNLMFEHALFNWCCLGEDEQFITNLYSLADLCAWGDGQVDMITDQIVVHYQQVDADLTLEMAKWMVRQREADPRERTDDQPNGMAVAKRSKDQGAMSGQTYIVWTG